MSPSSFIPSEIDPPVVYTPVNPPIATDPTSFTIPTDVTYGPYLPQGDSNGIVTAIVVIIILMLFMWWYFDLRKKVQFEDIRPSLKHLSSSEVSLNKAAAIQMIPFMPPLVGIVPVIYMVEETPLLALATLIGLISLPALMYMYLAKKSLEENKGKVNMMGLLRNKTGDRERYFWRDVDFLSEKHLTDEELTNIDDAKIVFKAEMITVIAEREKKRKAVNAANKKLPIAEQSPPIPIEHPKDVWKRGNLDSVHAIPIRIDNTHDAYLMSKHLTSEWEFTDGEDYNYYGYHDVKITGPELRLISTMHRVIELDNEDFRDEYCPVFLVMYDDVMSKEQLGAISPIDITRDHAVAGICKAVGADERTTAGELNSITSQVMVLENEDKDLDDLSQTIGRKKAIDFITAEKRLTLFDASMLGSVSTIVAIVFAAVTYLLGHSIGAGG